MFNGRLSASSVVGLSRNFVSSQVTTARKAVTLLLSYLIFTKPLTEQHGTGLLLISMGIAMKLLPDNKPPKRAKIEKPACIEVNRARIENEVEEEKRPLF